MERQIPSLVVFTADMPAISTSSAKTRDEGMIDPYAQGGDVGLHNEPHEMDEDERDEAIYRQRLFDAPGEDTAYTTGLSETFLPAPEGGWSPDASPKELSV